MRFDSKTVHAGSHTDSDYGALVPPLYLANAFTPGNAEETAEVVEQIQSGTRDRYLYTRWGNPTLTVLEEKMAELEGGESALAFSTGMAAISTLLFSLLRAGDHIIAARQTYSGTYSLLTKVMPRFGIEVSLVDFRDLEQVARQTTPTTKVLYIETPSNPLLEIVDIRATVALAQSRKLISVIDNTFATPYNQRPLELGVDFSVYSTTKFLSGHGDNLGGVVIGNREFIDNDLIRTHRDLGGVMSPFNAWLTVRGLQTLALRMERHNDNALRIARFLETHPAVERVYYPGLESHVGHQTAKRQMSGFTGMLSFELRGGFKAGKRFIDQVKLCLMGATLGDVKTIVTHAASTTHYIMGNEGRKAAGISEGLVRISVGIENPQDLIEDINQALE